jgi:outer membrane protein OmpA-like peptidoglycan-associated protein
MSIKNAYWIAGALAVVGLGVFALTQQARSGSLEAAETGAGQLARRYVPDSATVVQPSRDLRAALAAPVHFGVDQSMIGATDAEILDAKVSIMQAHPHARIRIIGHSDERGAEIYNLALGRRRAVAAKQYLVEHGVEASRIEAVSAGVGQPLDLRHNQAAWAKDRRDEFEIIDGGTQPERRP